MGGKKSNNAMQQLQNKKSSCVPSSRVFKVRTLLVVWANIRAKLTWNQSDLGHKTGVLRAKMALTCLTTSRGRDSLSRQNLFREGRDIQVTKPSKGRR